MFKIQLTYTKTNKFGEKDVCVVPLVSISIKEKSEFVECRMYGEFSFKVDKKDIVSIVNI